MVAEPDHAGAVLIGAGAGPSLLHLALANRHGLVAGATGTGKTITLQTLAEGFSRAGVPVFAADVKGDLAGLAQAGAPQPRIEARAREVGALDFAYAAAPVVFWDLFGTQGHPIRATVAEMGPLLLARLLDLNETQAGVLAIAFKLADDEGLLLLDFKDLTSMLQEVAARAATLTTIYGNVSKASVGAIQRRLLTLEQEGGEHFFGEPALDLADLLLVTAEGRGAINILAADRLMRSPRLYATFLLWLLSELFEQLPEVGDEARPRLVFFFDEAHLLFSDTPKALLTKVEQVVRLIRSKGVGVYFVTQNPLDVPATVLGQLGNRVQHALRAFTPAEQKAVRGAAETFRPNPRFSTGAAITELGVGEALVSTLQPDGTPGIVDRVKVCPPRSRLGAVTAEERQAVVARSPIGDKYDQALDRESAYEILAGRASTAIEATAPQPAWDPGGTVPQRGDPWGTTPRQKTATAAYRTPGGASGGRPRRVAAPRAEAGPGVEGMLGSILSGGGGRRQGMAEVVAKSVARSVSNQVGRQVGNAIVRGLLGSILKR